VRPEALGNFKKSPHRVSNQRPSGLQHSALTTMLLRATHISIIFSLILNSHLRLGLQSGLFLSRFCTRTLYALLTHGNANVNQTGMNDRHYTDNPSTLRQEITSYHVYHPILGLWKTFNFGTKNRVTLVSYLAYSSTLQMEATISSETSSAEFQRTTRRYIPEDTTLQNVGNSHTLHRGS
jgi:hypothetical protein